MCIARAINLENRTQSQVLHCSSSTKPSCIALSTREPICSSARCSASHWFPGPTCQTLPASHSPSTLHSLSLSLSMRIRKNASKLLGSAIVYSSAPFPPPSDTWDPPSSSNPSLCASSGELCELNQSPWDVYPNLHLLTSSFKDVESAPCLKEAQEEVPDAISENNKGISGNSPEKETTALASEAKPLQVCKRSNVKKNRDNGTTIKKKVTKKNKTTPILCKKNDGKKWFCKRPAQMPHSFCEYHLSQSRSYYANHTGKASPEQGSSCKTSKKKQNGGTSSSPYYYYNGYGPYSRKRRGLRNADGGDHAMHVDGERKVGDETMHVDNTKKADDAMHLDDGKEVGNNAMHTDDEKEVGDNAMHVDDEKKVDGRGASAKRGAEEHCAVVAKGGDEDEKKVSKKRRRKPTKCRSLKSLL